MSSTYDPEEYGARCRECALRTCREGRPVPPETIAAALVAAIGSLPGVTEVADGRPWVGAAGMVATRGFYRVGSADGEGGGLMRDQVHWTNVLLCRPPRGDLRAVLLAPKAENTRRKAQGLPALPTPAECCAPRLANELARFPALIPMGTEALHACTTVRQGIQAV